MNPDLSDSLEQQIGELRLRVRRLEEALVSQDILKQQVVAPAVPPSPAPPAFQAAPVVERGVAQPPMTLPPVAHAPLFSSHGPAQPEDSRSLESRIGSQWFNRVGILAVLIGMAWFLKFAIDNHWIGPLGRVLIGLVAGAALIAWSERFRGKGYAVFSYSLKAVGSGALYLSLWAAFQLYHLMPSGAAFASMIVVTAFNGFMAWEQDAELLALYAIVGGLSTPLLLSTGENHQVALFSYLLLIDVAVLILVALRPWSRLLFGAFTGTVLFYFGWSAEFYSNAQALRTAFFLTCFFLILPLRLAWFSQSSLMRVAPPTGIRLRLSCSRLAMQHWDFSPSTQSSIVPGLIGRKRGWQWLSLRFIFYCCVYPRREGSRQAPRSCPHCTWPRRSSFSPSPYRSRRTGAG